ncbi:zinc-binding protein A33-like [Sardina pilchardus]|uniref:zinc-binding protein A33-like n=1 Tax=Sardina pilchardus TaxID=27697 RepID=UPI002E1358CC
MDTDLEGAALEELHKELTCPVCLDLFREPVILECGHHFCRACIGRCWEAKSEDESTCPQCRKTCTKTLRPNSLLCNVVDSVRRARAMDDARPKDPQPVRRSPSPEASSASCSCEDSETKSDPDMCVEHEEKLKLYCEDDQVAICLVCGMSRDHKTHNVIPINEAFENYKEKLCLALERVGEQRKDAAAYQFQTNDRILLLKERAGELDHQISTEYQELRDFLSRQEEEMKARLRQAKEQKLGQLNDLLTQTTEQMSELELAAKTIHTKLNEEDNPKLLTGVKCFIESAECVFDKPQSVCVELQEGEFVGPLQYRAWKKLNSVLKPAVHTVVLDPSTAYPRLHVSPCGRSVRVGDIQSGLPNNPERFTLYNIVLGTEPFTEGRHYWEVEVGAKTAWGLGVAAASVNRKEEISLCPEDGFWTLVLSNGSEYEACTTAEDCPLNLSRHPDCIGIYLDYDRGLVAFYDAGDMSHLFTFSDAHFTEPVYPYFNPWPIINGRNWEPLTIRTPLF